MQHKVRIVMTGHGRGEVFIDDKKVSVRAIEFSASAINGGDLNTVKLIFSAAEVEIDGVAEVTVIGDTERKFRKVA